MYKNFYMLNNMTTKLLDEHCDVKTTKGLRGGKILFPYAAFSVMRFSFNFLKQNLFFQTRLSPAQVNPNTY